MSAARIAVVVRDDVGAEGLLDRDERAERHHLAGGVARLQREDVLTLRAERRIRLRDHLVGAAEAVEVVHVQRAEVHLHRLEDVGELHALLLGSTRSTFTVSCGTLTW